MSLRRLRVLVQHLPADSASACMLRGNSWTDKEYLLALLVDHLALSRYEFAKANGGSPDEPQPVHRPGDEAPEDRRELLRAAHDSVMAQIKGA
jgi:hypothetical protein